MKRETLSQQIKEGKFHWINQDIGKYFNAEDIRSSDFKLFQFDNDSSSEEALKYITEEGYLPANVSELLLYAKKAWNDEDWIMAFGSSARVDVNRFVVCLDSVYGRRFVDLIGWDGGWRGVWRFLAIKSDTTDTSDSLSLKQRIEELEAWRNEVKDQLLNPFK